MIQGNGERLTDWRQTKSRIVLKTLQYLRVLPRELEGPSDHEENDKSAARKGSSTKESAQVRSVELISSNQFLALFPPGREDSISEEFGRTVTCGTEVDVGCPPKTIELSDDWQDVFGGFCGLTCITASCSSPFWFSMPILQLARFFVARLSNNFFLLSSKLLSSNCRIEEATNFRELAPSSLFVIDQLTEVKNL